MAFGHVKPGSETRADLGKPVSGPHSTTVEPDPVERRTVALTSSLRILVDQRRSRKWKLATGAGTGAPPVVRPAPACPPTNFKILFDRPS